MKRVTFGVDEFGNRLGEAHHRAKLSDEDVEHIRDLYETGMIGYTALAIAFGVSKSQIRKIVNYQVRATTPIGYKTVKEHELKRPIPISRRFDEMEPTPEENPIGVLEAQGAPRGITI